MSEYLPLEIQLEIIERVPDVKSLARFRSVSKTWKSLIDSSYFIASYDARHTDPHRFLLFYKKADGCYKQKYTCFVDEDNDTSTQRQGFAPIVYTAMQLQVYNPDVIGCSRGLLYMHNHNRDMVVLCNPFLRKSVRIVAPSVHYISTDRFGFGVCPVTNDPTIVRISYPRKLVINRNIDNIPWHVEVFTLSSGVWNILPCGNLPRGSITLESSQVVIDRFIYWVAYKMIARDGDSWKNYMIMSFDLIAKEFRVVDIPDSLKLDNPFFSISKLMESLVLFVCGKGVCGVWKIEHDGSCTKLFTFSTRDDSKIRIILGFRKNGELVMQTQKTAHERIAKLKVYEPCSKQINNFGIKGINGSFFMSS